jgi:Flp pilus assembly protein TadG
MIHVARWGAEWREGLSGFLRATSGAAAMEFAIIAPIMFFAFVAAVDIGFATYERSRLDQLARNGAEAAMLGLSPAEIEKVLAAAIAQSRVSIGGGTMAAQVDEFCSCSGASTQISCSDTCAGFKPPSRYTLITLQLTHRSFILPDFDLESRIQVQKR